MSQLQTIITVLDWEKRLEIEEEKRKNHRTEPYVNYLAKPQGARKERMSIFAWLRGLGINRQAAERQPVVVDPQRVEAQPTYRRPAKKCCPEMQPGC